MSATRRTRCNGCGQLYLADLPGKKTGVCPEAICTARRAWTPDHWEGRARMAQARIAAGLPTDALDDLALERTP